jgi:hypothetical protein
MNKKQIIASLNDIANTLDNSGLYVEANTIAKIMSKLAMDKKDVYSKDNDYDEKYDDNPEIRLLEMLTLIDEDYRRNENKKFEKDPYKENREITLLDVDHRKTKNKKYPKNQDNDFDDL